MTSASAPSSRGAHGRLQVERRLDAARRSTPGGGGAVVAPTISVTSAPRSRGRLGDREAHLAGRAVADVADRVDRLLGAAGRSRRPGARPGRAAGRASARSRPRSRPARPCARARRGRTPCAPRAAPTKRDAARLAAWRRSPAWPRAPTCAAPSPARAAAAPRSPARSSAERVGGEPVALAARSRRRSPARRRPARPPPERDVADLELGVGAHRSVTTGRCVIAWNESGVTNSLAPPGHDHVDQRAAP